MSAPYRSEHVGSLLRPKRLLNARAAAAAGRIDAAELRGVEDECVLEALALQRDVGIDVCTDGELRRSSWGTAFMDAVEGFALGRPALPLRLFRGERAAAERVDQREQPALQVITRELVQRKRLTNGEAAFLRANASSPFKVTLAAPSYTVARTYTPGVSDRVYPTRADALAAVAAIARAEIAALVADGVTYVQLDNPHIPDYVNEDSRAAMRDIGIDPDRALAEDVAADNAALAGLDRSVVTTAMHLCRGNGARGEWHTAGGYDRIAEAVFGGVEVDRFLLEYDSERAGTFDPLRHMPATKTVVLGLVTTKAGELEPADLLRRRIDEASRRVPVERLALSPQCGFASSPLGGPLSPDEQRAKLALVATTARDVWSA